MNRSLSIFLTTTALIAAASAQAQEEGDDAVDLGTLVLSGGLTPIEGSALGRSNTVIDVEALEAQNKRFVADILRTVPGLSVSRTGAAGSITQVRIRGNEANATKVFIDGIDVSSPSQGEFDFGSLLTADIKRIEILRGPQSSIFGSNALGGVISITTKRATEPGVSGSVSAELGTDTSVNALIAGRFRGPRGDLSLSAAGFSTDGFDISGTDDNNSAFFDGTDNQTLSANGRYFVSDTVTVGGVLRFTDRSVDSDDDVFGAATVDALVEEADNRNDTMSLYGLAFAEIEALDGRMLNRFEISAVDEESDSFTDGDQTFGNKSGRTRFSYIGTVALDASTLSAATQTLSFSYQWQKETFQNTNGDGLFFPPPADDPYFDEQKRTQNSYVLEYRGSFFDALELQASVRHDDNEDFEDFTSYALGASYLIASTGTRFHASVGTGSVNPTFTEQFGFFNDYVGNPDLMPEESFAWDIGVEQSFWNGRGLIDVTYFDEELENEIRDTFTSSINLEETSFRRGIELTGFLAAGPLTDLTLGYTWLDATEFVPASNSEEPEVRRPEHELTIGLRQRLPNQRTEFNLDLQYVSNLYDLDFLASADATGRTKLDDYTLVDFGVRHVFSDQVTFRASVTNLFDEKYQELQGYATQGRTLYAGISASF